MLAYIPYMDPMGMLLHNSMDARSNSAARRRWRCCATRCRRSPPLGEVMMNSRLTFPLETWEVQLSHFNSQDMMNMMGSTAVDMAIRICTRYGCPKKPWTKHAASSWGGCRLCHMVHVYFGCCVCWNIFWANYNDLTDLPHWNHG